MGNTAVKISLKSLKYMNGINDVFNNRVVGRYKKNKKIQRIYIYIYIYIYI